MSVNLNFSWNVGNTPLYYYRVIGECLDLSCDNAGFVELCPASSDSVVAPVVVSCPCTDSDWNNLCTGVIATTATGYKRQYKHVNYTISTFELAYSGSNYTPSVNLGFYHLPFVGQVSWPVWDGLWTCCTYGLDVIYRNTECSGIPMDKCTWVTVPEWCGDRLIGLDPHGGSMRIVTASISWETDTWFMSITGGNRVGTYNFWYGSYVGSTPAGTYTEIVGSPQSRNTAVVVRAPSSIMIA